MIDILKIYLERQTRWLRLFFHIESLSLAFTIYSLFLSFSVSLGFVLFSVKGIHFYSQDILKAMSWVGALIALIFFLKRFVSAKKNISIVDAARRIEEMSEYFRKTEHQSDLVTAAAFVQDVDPHASAEFQYAHLKSISQRLPKYRLQISPRVRFFKLIAMGFVTGVLASFVAKNVTPQLPRYVYDSAPVSFEELLPSDSAVWTAKNGSWTSTIGAKIRFPVEKSWILQKFLYVQEDDRGWLAVPCQEYCEWTLKTRAAFSIGTAFGRSSSIPVQANPDEMPKAVILLKKGSELVPNATVQVRDQKHLDLQLLASDDLELKTVEVIHHFSSEEKILTKFKPSGNRLSKEFMLDLSNWRGGQHQLTLRARDYVQSKDSLPLTIIYLDEEFLRKERIQGIQDLVTEWVHVLADLLETQSDSAVAKALPGRLAEMQFPERLEEPSFKVFVEGLKRLRLKIKSEIVEKQNFRMTQSLIQQTEKEILYGLSLLFKEKAGDVKSSVAAMQENQKSLQQMLEEMKKSGKIDSDKLQEMFKQLQDQLKEIQEKLSQLPDGPQDDLINRQALQEQVEESKELQEKIEDIQKQLSEGKSEEAMKELQSLLNQLSILNKEIERSFDQWQQNLDKGSMEAAQKFQQKIDELRNREEKLSKEAETLKREEELTKDMSFGDPARKEKQEATKQKSENLKKEQDDLKAQLEKASEEFQKALEGSEWESVLRGGEIQELEGKAGEKMSETSESLKQRRTPDAEQASKEVVEVLHQMGKQMQQNQKTLQQMSQPQSGEQMQGMTNEERVEVIESEGKGQKEKRRKIMDSLKQHVDEKYQKSHERYFEDLLQR